jgi:glycosyltransferase involved in cell wall biosynthesis
MAVAFAAAGLSTELVGVPAAGSRQQHPLRAPVQRELRFRDSLYCVNADQLDHVVRAVDGRPCPGGRRVGLWFWEVEVFPRRWLAAFELLDEVWTASPFTRDVLAASAPVPVHLVPLPVWAPSAPTPFRREQLGLPVDRFVYLFTYDIHSVLARKNPLDLIDAYTRAFGPQDGASLVLKSINGTSRPLELDRVRQAAAGRPDIVVIDGYVDAHRLRGLIELSDCFVSLHRSEGFGLNLAAAMAVGRPVIATAYSGNLAFMGADSAFLVPHDLVPVGDGHAPYPPEARWAQPDLDAAARQMRLVFEQPDLARHVAEQGRRSVLASHSPARAGAAVASLVAPPAGTRGGQPPATAAADGERSAGRPGSRSGRTTARSVQ